MQSLLTEQVKMAEQDISAKVWMCIHENKCSVLLPHSAMSNNAPLNVPPVSVFI